MKLSAAGAEFIANFEGFRADPYWDVNHWSIGYGTPSSEGARPITRAEGMRRLRAAVNEHFAPAVRAIGVQLNQDQFDALTSFAYNLGPGVIDGLDGDAVFDAVKRGDFRAAGDAMLSYNRASGVVLPGLARRRQMERALLLKRQPVRYTKEERHLLAVLKDKQASKTRRTRAAGTLRRLAREIQLRARREDDWQKADRGRRFKGIRGALRKYA